MPLLFYALIHSDPTNNLKEGQTSESHPHNGLRNGVWALHYPTKEILQVIFFSNSNSLSEINDFAKKMVSNDHLAQNQIEIYEIKIDTNLCEL